MRKKIFVVSILAAISLQMYAECSGWSVVIKQQSMNICTASIINLEMQVLNDTSTTLDSCKYSWLIKKPSSLVYEQVATTSKVGCLFDEVGSYSIKAAAQPNECTIFHESSPIAIVLYPTTTAGTITGTQTICYNSQPTTLSQASLPTGGDGNFSYQWQSKTTGSWTNITGATNTTYQPSALIKTTTYRVQYSNGCTSVFSNEVKVTVRPNLTAPTIAAVEGTICYKHTATLNCLGEASGGADDSFNYQWQESTNGKSYTNIVGAAGLTYTTSSLTLGHWYRLVATSVKGCGSVTSNVIKVNVLQDLSISNSTISPLCYMATADISVKATGAGGNFLYQWQESLDGANFTDIASANTSSYSIPGKAAGTYYYRVLVAPTFGCSSKFSDIFTVTVYDNLVPGVIAGVDTVCYNNQPALLYQASLPTGGDGNFSYQWQSKTTGSWTNITGATNTTYQPDKLSTTTYFRLVATNTCGSIISNEIEVYVCQDLTAPIIPSTAETVCYGFAPALITIPTLATCDINDSLLYQWQELTSESWTDIIGATAHTYQPEAITEAHQYRVVATSIRGCGQVISNVRTVNVYNKLQITTTGIDPLCYMTRGMIRVSATGDGDAYAYQWQDSVAGVWSNVISGNTPQYLTQPKSGGRYFYRCIVVPTLGCTPDTSATINVLVYDSVDPGKISPMGVDTICYGFVPDAISVTVPSTGGDGNFTYQWLRRPEGATSFSYITGATETSYSPTALTKTMEYQLEVTNACDVKYTNIVRIYVRDEIQAPVLVEHLDTICYNTIPDPIIVSYPAIGGIDDIFTYQWLFSEDGINFSEIPGESDTIYQPSVLFKKTFYQLRATSTKLCGDILSNIVTVNVFDSLHITAIDPDTLCCMTSTRISISAIGGGERYYYQWQEFVDADWQNIAGATMIVYETQPKPQGDYLYRCIITSAKCESYSRISPIITVPVFNALAPGTIIGTDSTCFGYAPKENLRVDIPATGGGGRYSYQWQSRENGEWKNIVGETGTSYLPEPLKVSADFRLQVASKCDTLYTNSIFIRVNSLPDIQSISGSNNVCYNQHEIYSVEKLNSGYTYEWMIERGKGELTTEALNTAHVDVLWKIPNSNDSVILRVTNDITGCERNLKFGVSICNEQAPERTIVVRKPNSNILVCKEDGNLIYQWGYTEKSSQKEFLIDDSNRRYVLLPHSFNNDVYDYWLSLRRSTTSPCYSKSYYSPENDEIINSSAAKISVPSFVQGRIPLDIQNPDCDIVYCTIYAVSGELIGQYELGDESYLSTTLPVVLSTGMYVLRATIGEYVESIKLIAE